MKIISRLLAVALFCITALACTGGGGGTTSIFSPAPGTEFGSEGGSVSLVNIPAGSSVYVTTDGEDPTADDCEVFNTSTPIPITVNRTVKVLIVTAGVAQPIKSAVYTVAGSGGGSTYTNLEMVKSWVAWERATRCLTYSANNCEPSGLGSWSHTCENGGTISWSITLSGLSGNSQFTYNNCQHTIPDPDGSGNVTLTVGGNVGGVFNSGGTGNTSGTANLSGTYTGTIVDNIQVVNRVKQGGNYTTTCSIAGCASGQAIYLAPDWTYFESNTGGSDVLSCTPWVQIRHTDDGKCLATKAGGNRLNVATCSVDDPAQQWKVSSVGSNFSIESVEQSGECIQDLGGNDSRQQWYNTADFFFELRACGGNYQNFAVTKINGGGTNQWFIENTARDACFYSNSGFNAGDIYAAGGNCSWATLGYPFMKWGFYAKGLGGDIGPTGAAGL